MKSFAVLALAATALAQSAPPAGCQASASGTFQISTVNVTSSRKRDLESRQLAGILTMSLENGNLRDQAGRTGYIASNFQFQFDAPVQAGAREQTGFSLCSNGSLALGSSAIWYACLSGDFYNLYSQSTGAQCSPIYITAVMGGGASQISDGQPQVTSRPAVSQISDGQPQASSAGPIVSQISDGQPQAPSARPPVVSQISDGQPQAGTPMPTPGPVISQISDGQPQAPIATGRPPVVSQISDGQPQAPIATPTGNMTAPNATRPVPSQFTGAAASSNAATGALLAGLLGLFAML
jgi:hypothetical protein